MKLKTSFEFDAAHRLVGYDGKCSRLHGHMWHVDLEIEGEELDEVGILWDFTNVKDLKELFDHKTILWSCKENTKLIKLLLDMTEGRGVYIMNCNPTAENLCKEILAHCKTSNPDLKYKVTVYESPKSYAEIEG